MRGFFLKEDGNYLDKTNMDSSELSLLARHSGTEIMLQKIKENRTFYIDPSENEDLMEFFYVLSGRVLCEAEVYNKEINVNDYFYIKNLEETIFFKALTDVTLMWISTTPVFHYISTRINELKKLVKEVEKKDRYTLNHSERVQEYSIKIAKKLKLSKDELDNLLISSVLHDVGKIHVSEQILNKNGRLTKEEFNIIKRHPVDGAAMIRETYYKSTSKIIEQHHERLDGSGYPNGLKGDEIVLGAKIIAVSDSFDAMTEDRSYRKAIPIIEAINEIEGLSGIYYEPEVVKALIEVLKEEGKI